MIQGMPGATTREIVNGVLDRLPADVPLEQVARELDFIAGVREGLAQLDRGESVPLEDVERRFSTGGFGASHENSVLSEQALAEDWNRAEEESAWSYLQPAP